MKEDNSVAAGGSAASDAGRADVIDFGRILRNYLRHWWLFAISLALCLGAAVFYVKKKSPIYLMKGLVMVNQQEEGGMTQAGCLTAMLSSFGMGGGGGANPENETMKLISNTNLTDVVNTLQLQKGYWLDNGFFSRRTNLYKDAPFVIDIPQNILDTISATTFFRIKTDGKSPLHLTVEQGKHTVIDTDVRQFPYMAKTPYGSFNITQTSYYQKGQPLNMRAVVVSTPVAVDDLLNNINVSYLSNKADAIQVDMADANIERGNDIVNTTIALYNERRLNDRMTYNKETLDFIEQRLLNLYNELEVSESKIENYKRDNKIVNAEAEAEYIFAQKGAIETNHTELRTRVEIYEMIKQMLSNPQTQYSLIPFTGGQLGLSEAYYKLIEGYNDLILQRMQLSSSAKPGSNAMNQIDTQIGAVRDNILNSVNRELQGARISLSAIAAEQGKSDSRMSQIPRMEHELIALYRDREVKNQIYAYLLQKREETQIQLSQNEPVAKVIDYSYPTIKPVKPNVPIVLAAGLLLGLLMPALYLQFFSRGTGNGKSTKNND